MTRQSSSTMNKRNNRLTTAAVRAFPDWRWNASSRAAVATLVLTHEGLGQLGGLGTRAEFESHSQLRIGAVLHLLTEHLNGRELERNIVSITNIEHQTQSREIQIHTDLSR